MQKQLVSLNKYTTSKEEQAKAFHEEVHVLKEDQVKTLQEEVAMLRENLATSRGNASILSTEMRDSR